MQRDKESIYLDKAVRKYHEVSKKELENVCAFVNDKPYPHPELTRYKKRPISEHIWFAGIDKWGRRWIEREYVLACRRDDVIIDEIT